MSMNEVNKTLYIPLYGKAMVSRAGIILKDTKAEQIWEKEGFPLKGKAKSKWLTYYMGMRAAVFDKWVKERLVDYPAATVLHIGCGMDSRIDRAGAKCSCWYDVDFPSVIEERKKYYKETASYHMIEGDARNPSWVKDLPQAATVIVVMEGVTMYLNNDELAGLLFALKAHFGEVYFLADFYTEFAAKASKYKNPINEVGVSSVSGLDNPTYIREKTGLRFVCEHNMTPPELTGELRGLDRTFFKITFTGGAAKKIYRLFEYST